MLIALVMPSRFTQAANPLIEVTTSSRTYTGQSVAHNRSQCWLMERNGRLQKIAMEQVEGFRQLAPEFRGASAAELRSELISEFGKSLEIKASTHYLVVAAPGRAEHFAELFEQHYREFYVYLSTRQFAIEQPPFPLVAIIFPDQLQFADYARSEGIKNTTGLAGYYERSTNRIAAFEPGTNGEGKGKVAALAATNRIAAPLQQTLRHEATHQIAFNLGLHSRIGPTPRWVLEGLAIVFEHPDARSGSQSLSARQRMHQERYLWFGNYRKERRPASALKAFLEQDRLFQAEPLDAYSEAWALTFFLTETRPAAYARFLQRISQRDPLQAYSAAERTADFQSAFGSDLDRLEVEYLRFIDRL